MEDLYSYYKANMHKRGILPMKKKTFATKLRKHYANNSFAGKVNFRYDSKSFVQGVALTAKNTTSFSLPS